jgi:hypothetical protein
MACLAHMMATLSLRHLRMSKPVYQSRVDVAAVVRGFLTDLRPDDILTELIQNDLDQGATLTRIEITRDQLTCEGNGRPVDEKGWLRLSYALGAGEEVEAKLDGIGAKNHGLRSCFCLGDTIVVRSGGQRIQLTVCGQGGRRFYPATWDVLEPDLDGPAHGCRIEVSLRKQPLQFSGPDVAALRVPSESDLEALFSETSEQAPQRFLGCLRPGFYNAYTLELVHWRLGTYRFSYTSKRLPSRGRVPLYRRECVVKVPGRDETIREDGFSFTARIAGSKGHRIPRFYKMRGGVLCEVAWRVDERGRPIQTTGRLRYPIGYSTDGPSAKTGMAVHYSAPFVSDQVRHGVAAGEADFNSDLIKACDAALVKALREHLIPRFGPSALELLRDPQSPSPSRERSLILSAAVRGALPAAAPMRAIRSRRDSRASRSGQTRCVPVQVASGFNFLVPCYTWKRDEISSSLAELCPGGVAQLHPRCPEFVVKVLSDAVYENDDERANYFTFDEDDVIDRLQPSMVGYFPWANGAAWKSELGDPARVRKYLAIVSEAIRNNAVGKDQRELLKKNGVLPDAWGEPTPWSELQRLNGSAPDVPGVLLPSFLHQALLDVPILRSGALRLETFDLDAHLSGLDFRPVAPTGRAEFFAWLRAQGHALIKGATLAHIAEYPIWPTDNGAYVSFSDFCFPSDSKLRSLLSEHLNLPSQGVLRFPKVRRDGRGLLRLRTIPNDSELEQWYEGAFRDFDDTEPLVAEERRRFRATEDALAYVCFHPLIKRRLRWLPSTHFTLNREGMLAATDELHLDNERVRAAALLPEDIISGSHDSLYRALHARECPSADAVVRALQRDTGRTEAVFIRIAEYVKALERGETAEPIGHLEIIPVDGELHAPYRLAFKGSPDYWGQWKQPIAVAELSAERQANLRAIGVISTRPLESTSQQFFRWLSSQPRGIIQAHLDQVIRHLDHEFGPLRWWNRQTDLPCLPVRGHKGSIRLVNYRQALGRPGNVLLPDFRELEDHLLERDGSRALVIVGTSNVRVSLLSRLRECGLPSLRLAAGPPIRVWGEAETRHLPWQIGCCARCCLVRWRALFRSASRSSTFPGIA